MLYSIHTCNDNHKETSLGCFEIDVEAPWCIPLFFQKLALLCIARVTKKTCAKLVINKLIIYRLETKTEGNLVSKRVLLDLDTFSFAFLSLGSHNGEMFVTCIRFKLGRTKRVLSALTFRFVPLRRNPFVRWWRGSIKLDWWNYTFGINLCREEEDWCSWRTIRLGSKYSRLLWIFQSNLYFFDIF